MKRTYITPSFISSLTDTCIIVGFVAYVIQVPTEQMNALFNNDDVTGKRLLNTSFRKEWKKCTFHRLINTETVLLKNSTKLMLSTKIPIDVNSSTQSHYIAYTYKAFTFSTFSNTTKNTIYNFLYPNIPDPTTENPNPTANLFFNETPAFVFEWWKENNGIKESILTQTVGSSLRVFIDLSDYRNFSNILSITDNAILHSHDFELSRLSNTENYDVPTHLSITCIKTNNYSTDCQLKLPNEAVPSYVYYNCSCNVIDTSTRQNSYESFINPLIFF